MHARPVGPHPVGQSSSQSVGQSVIRSEHELHAHAMCGGGPTPLGQASLLL